MSKDVDVRAKYEERINIANQAATPISYRSRNELALILSKGILLKGAIVMSIALEISISKHGEYQEMLFMKKDKSEEPHDMRYYGSVLYLSPHL
ncbi:hypothetical protein L1987_55823 [Smallanthus sonchifolius]|uniref:Uncharacterized protein n=1 Tax=Smallanthus sonchifolius TaxID=185202 RepID=A0ACB9EC35_9ASTR|nr:hypothetical protein L1987_55823 [Smallanthus sonchifolius]